MNLSFLEETIGFSKKNLVLVKDVLVLVKDVLVKDVLDSYNIINY